MTLRIVRRGPPQDSLAGSAVALGAYSLAYLAWTDWGGLYLSLREVGEWTLALLFAVGATMIGALAFVPGPEIDDRDRVRIDRGIPLLLAFFIWAPALLSGRFHPLAIWTPLVFGGMCFLGGRVPGAAKLPVLYALAMVLAVLVQLVLPAADLGRAVLWASAAFPAVWVLLRKEGDASPSLVLSQMAAVLGAEELLRTTVLPWNGLRGVALWGALAAGSVVAAAGIRGVVRTFRELDRFSGLALSIGSLLLLAVGRRAHDPRTVPMLILLGTIGIEFGLLVFLGVEHLRRKSEGISDRGIVGPPCVVPFEKKSFAASFEIRFRD